ncbi:hypothetical protein ACS0TY_025805 [Phlomoides rotata]
MTFFIVPVNSTQPTGGEGGDFGIFGAVTEESPIFAIEFGAYVNSVRIGINSKVSQNAIFRYPIGEIMTVGITYDALSRITTLVGTYGSQTSKFPFGYDMKVHSLLPQQVQMWLDWTSCTILMLYIVCKSRKENETIAKKAHLNDN